MVVSIILILAGLLLPVLSKMREKGNRTNCLSNLSQIAKAAIMYSDDYESYFPPEHVDINNIGGFQAMIEQGVLLDGELMVCPSSPQRVSGALIKLTQELQTNYAYFGDGKTNAMNNSSNEAIAGDLQINHGGRWRQFSFVDGHTEGLFFDPLPPTP